LAAPFEREACSANRMVQENQENPVWPPAVLTADKRSYILRLTESTLVEALNIAVEARPSIQPGLHIPIYLCTSCEREILL